MTRTQRRKSGKKILMAGIFPAGNPCARRGAGRSASFAANRSEAGSYAEAKQPSGIASGVWKNFLPTQCSYLHSVEAPSEKPSVGSKMFLNFRKAPSAPPEKTAPRDKAPSSKAQATSTRYRSTDSRRQRMERPESSSIMRARVSPSDARRAHRRRDQPPPGRRYLQKTVYSGATSRSPRAPPASGQNRSPLFASPVR